jgi:hypothetical protein
LTKNCWLFTIETLSGKGLLLLLLLLLLSSLHIDVRHLIVLPMNYGNRIKFVWVKFVWTNMD